jgi:hypothetical protein
MERAEAVHAPNKPRRRLTWKRYLTFLSKFQNKVKHKTKPAGDAKAAAAAVLKKQRNPKPKRYSPLLEECSNLVHVIRRTTVGCIEAAGDGEDELPSSYVQLDQLNYGVKRGGLWPHLPGHLGCSLHLPGRVNMNE